MDHVLKSITDIRLLYANTKIRLKLFEQLYESMDPTPKTDKEQLFDDAVEPVGNGKRVGLESNGEFVGEVEEQPFGSFSKYRFQLWTEENGKWRKKYSKQFDTELRARKKLDIFKENGAEVFPVN